MIDGHPEVRAVLGHVLRGEGYEVHTDADGRSLGKIMQNFRPDLVILAVGLPTQPDGCELTRLLRRSSDIPILLLDEDDSASARVAGLEAGADDVLPLPVAVDAVLGHTQVLLRRTGRLTSAVRQVGDLLVDEGSRTAVRAGEALDLTRTEFELLSLFTRVPGRVLPKRQVFSELWGLSEFDPHLVEVHVSSLRRKLEAHGPRIIETVHGTGYVLGGR